MRKELLQEAVRRYGTPLYLFNLDLLEEQTGRIRAGLGQEIRLCYAMKANPFLTEVMAQWVDRIEVCSMGEFRICRQLGIPAEKLFISGVMKKREDIREILAYCGSRSVYTAESPLHFKYFTEWSEEHPEKDPLKLYLRLTSGNQFGMDEKTVTSLMKEAQKIPGIKIEGIHYFSGTQKKKLKQHQKELVFLDEFLMRLEQEKKISVKCLEYGPGTAVPYFRGKTAETFEEDGLKGLQDTVKKMQWNGNVTVELGRALAATCGYYLTKVEDTKTSDGINYCIVDGGTHQLNYDGQIKGMYEPYVKVLPGEMKEEQKTESEESLDKNVEKTTNQKDKVWRICGSLCTLNDVLCNEIAIGNLKEGNVLAFERTGAYSAMEGMALFLSHELPGVVLYSEEDGWIQAREQQETYPLNSCKKKTDML